jgi:hypothetical protein
MRLRYETGTAAFTQFLVVTSLSFINGVSAIISGCTGHNKDDCVSNGTVSLLFILLTVGWLGFVWAVGFAAQAKRNHHLAVVLIAIEGCMAVVSLFDARHHPNILGLVTSLIDAAVALWVALLAYRLSRSKGGRIPVKTTVKRQRPKPPVA